MFDNFTVYSTPTTAEEVEKAYELRKQYRKEWRNHDGRPFSFYNTPWNASGAASPSRIGRCVSLIRASEATTFPQWQAHYMEKMRPKLWEAAKSFREYTAQNGSIISYEDAWIHAVIHAVDQTWEGAHLETRIKTALREWVKGEGYTEFTVRTSTDEVDRLLKVDLELCHEAKVLVGLQVKPVSFLVDRFDRQTQGDRLIMAKAHAAYTEDTCAEVYFISFTNVECKEQLTLWKPLYTPQKNNPKNPIITYHPTNDLDRLFDAA